MLSIPVLRWLWSAAFALLVGHVVTLYLFLEHDLSREYSVGRQLDLNAEANLAAWFESFLLLTCAGVTLVLASHFRAQQAPMAHRWVALSGLFGLMAIDETAQLHDMFTGPLRRGLEIDFGVFYFAWLLPAVGFLAVCAWYFAPIALSLTSEVRNRLLGAIGVYFGGAIVVEMLSGFAVEHGRKSAPYLAVLTFEETCEIVGMLLVVGALFALLRTVQPMTTLAIGAGGHIGLAPVASRTSEPRAEQLP